MKKLIFGLLAVLMMVVFSCTPSPPKQELLGSVEEAVKVIEAYKGDVANFKIGLKSELTLENKVHPFYESLSMITNAVLKKGWTLNGNEEVSGGKVYFYKKKE